MIFRAASALLLLMVAALAQAEARVFSFPVNVDNLPSAVIAVTEPLQKAKVLRSDFIQTKNIAVLSRPLVSKGSLLRVNDRGLIWKINAPIQVAYKISSDGIKTLDPASGADAKPSFGGLSGSLGTVLSALVDGNVVALSRFFELYFIDAESSIKNHSDAGNVPAGSWMIGLIPRSDSLMSKGIKRIVLQGNQFIEQIKITEANSDTTQLMFSNFRMAPDTLSAMEESYFAH